MIYVPKFRAWDTEKNKMYYDIEGFYDTLGYEDWPRECHQCFGDFLEAPHVIVMQLFPLPDAEEKPIYEGDILLPVSTGQIAEDVYVANRHALAFGFRGTKPWANTFVDYSWDTITNPKAEKYRYLRVVGNIHENPELLVYGPGDVEQEKEDAEEEATESR